MQGAAALRYLLDADLSQKTARIAREAGLDVISAHERGWRSIVDEDLLRRALEEARVIVTQSYRDFIRYSQSWQQQGLQHAGILLVPSSLPPNLFAHIARALIRFEGEHVDDPMVPDCVWLSEA